MAAPAPPPTNKRSPSDFLKQVVGRPVIVKLNSGVTYHGILACLDGYMNIAMEQTEEYVNGQLNEKYGDAFIRGNNGMRSLFFLARHAHCFSSSKFSTSARKRSASQNRNRDVSPVIYEQHVMRIYCLLPA